jgi:sucrose-6-phosphate hydrolase SacC (GH32 family)
MKNWISILLISFLLFCFCEDQTAEDQKFVFSYFKGNGEDGLHLAYSDDGLSWKALNDDQPYLIPQLSEDKLMRDPCIIQGGDGKYHMVWTVSWNAKGIGYASSEDLIHWSEQQYIPVMEHEPEAKNSWAPEIFYDQSKEQYLIFWASTIPGHFIETENLAESDWNHRMYYTTTKDFKEFADTRLFLDPGFNVIDATITADGDHYVMIIKDETKFPEAQKNLHVLTSDDLYDWDVPVSESISSHWVEGPTITKVGADWVVYFDRYREHSFGALSSKNFVDWEDISEKIDLPEGIRHGTVFKISEDHLKKLKSPDEKSIAQLYRQRPAPKPVFRDPFHDGAADPSIVWNEKEALWYMFYTNRRANVEATQGVAWVHGTRIGIANSPDGKLWEYRGICNIDYGAEDYSHWAPEVLKHGQTYHMYLTIVPGTFSNWNHPRDIVHLTSDNLLDWNYQSTLPLANDKCIDACIFQKPDGSWRMYYNNEKDGKSIYYADSPDLYRWKDGGKKVITNKGEGPKVVAWKDSYWMFVDHWDGIGVYRSTDLENWEKQPHPILKQPGRYQDDQVIGQHPDVLVLGDRAYIYYFTHPGRIPKNKGIDQYETRRSSIQVAELFYENGAITCYRDRPAMVDLNRK